MPQGTVITEYYFGLCIPTTAVYSLDTKTGTQKIESDNFILLYDDAITDS
jgi:hypothetical protein